MHDLIHHYFAELGDDRGGIAEDCGHWIPEERPD
jgi:hypothetical protein